MLLSYVTRRHDYDAAATLFAAAHAFIFYAAADYRFTHADADAAAEAFAIDAADDISTLMLPCH